MKFSSLEDQKNINLKDLDSELIKCDFKTNHEKFKPLIDKIQSMYNYSILMGIDKLDKRYKL